MMKNYLLLLMIPCVSLAQGEFIAEVNVTDGTYVKTGPTIPDVTYVFPEDTAFDENTGTYFFVSSTLTQSLYSINTSDGSVVNNPLVSNIIQFEYDNSVNMMYAIKRSGGVKKLVSYDTATGVSTDLSSPFSDGSYNQGDLSAIDEANHIYYLVQAGTIYAIDTTNGDMLSSVPLVLPSGSVFLNISFDQSTGNLYGMISKNSVSKVFLVSVNAAAGTVSQIGTGTTFGMGNGCGTIDETNQHYIYCYNNTGNFDITVLNLADGAFVSNTTVNPLETQDNMHSVEYDNTQHKLFAMHWDALILNTTDVKDFSLTGVYPNPFHDFGFLDIPADGKTHNLLVYDTSGKVVMTKENINTGKVRIEGERFSGGVYFYRLSSGDAVVAQGKFVVK